MPNSLLPLIVMPPRPLKTLNWLTCELGLAAGSQQGGEGNSCKASGRLKSLNSVSQSVWLARSLQPARRPRLDQLRIWIDKLADKHQMLANLCRQLRRQLASDLWLQSGRLAQFPACNSQWLC